MNENANICTGKNAASSFQWSLVNNGAELDFIDGIVVIMKLNETSMMLSDKTALPDELILVYRH